MRHTLAACSLSLLFAAGAAAPLAGCASHGSGPKAPAAAKTKVTTKARVLSEALVNEYLDASARPRLPFGGSAADRDAFKARLALEKSAESPTPESAAIIPLIAGLIVEQLFALVVNEIKDYAKTFQADFQDSSTTYLVGSTTADFAAIELRRDFMTESNPDLFDHTSTDFQAIFRLCKVPGQPGLYTLRPVYFQENAAAARSFGHAMVAQVTVELSASWRDAQGVAHNEPILSDSFAIRKYSCGTSFKEKRGDLGPALISTADINYTSDAFALPSTPYALNATMKVHEADRGKAAKFIEALAGMVGGGKGEVVKIVKDKLGG